MAIMWHGGTRWDSYPQIKPAKRGRAEWGPGIYGTTHHARASQYAKGGKVTHLIEFMPRLFLGEAAIGLDTLTHFVKDNAPRSKQEEILYYLEKAASRNKIDGLQLLGEGPMARAEVIVNMWVNTDLSHGKRGPALSEFLSELGIDAHTDRAMSMNGTPEHWTVIFNPDAITGHTVIPAARVLPETWHLPSPLLDPRLTLAEHLQKAKVEAELESSLSLESESVERSRMPGP